ncbi:flagellin N-terminal helical domain-containing protein [Sulfurimonas sp.]
MRVTSSMYYKSLYGTNNSSLNTKLFDVNKQIASGLKIQYAKDDVATFTETMRLDNEVTTLEQIKKSTDSGYKISNQTDVTLNQFETDMSRMRTLLLSAANGTNDNTSLDSIAAELRGLEEGLKNLANTSINGQYLFSGSAVDVKPISPDGTYNGNGIAMNAFLGSNNQQQYNISGEKLFLGEEAGIRKQVTTNVAGGLNNPTTTPSDLSPSSTMLEFMGDSPSGNHYFYVRGVQSDGTAFNKKIVQTDTDTVDDLLNSISTEYGDVVNVSMNSGGQIIVEDKLKGSSKLDFHMVGATDFANAGNDNVTNIDSLDTGETDYATAFAGSSLYVREFVQSGLTQADTVSAAGNNIEGLLYDRTKFEVSGNTVSSNTSQINKTTNAFATPSTKLLDVASGTTLDGQQFSFTGTNVAGATFTAQIDFANAGSSFTVTAPAASAGTFDIFNADSTRSVVDSDDMTYQQLMDVMNMIVTNQVPAANTSAAYDTALDSANALGSTKLTSDGKLEFKDFVVLSNTNAEMALHDSTSGDFTSTALSSVMTFNTNNSLTIRDAKTDFFKTIDQMITAVEEHKLEADSSTGTKRGVGIEDGIAMMDDLQDHMFSAHSLVGAQSNSLTTALERTEILEIGTKTLRSSVIDTDLAEASLKLTQLTLNYEAMLSTVGRVSKLSLVNYL